MSTRTVLCCGLTALALTLGCSDGDQTAQNSTAEAAAAVRQLADDVWADVLENSTYYRLQDGLPIEKLEDLTLEEHHRNLGNAAAWRERLSALDAESLAGDDRITYDILAFQLQDDGAGDEDYWLNFDITAYQAPYVFNFAQQALGAHSFTDAESADHYLALVGEYADIVDQLTAKVEGQMERGIYLPKAGLPPTRATWQGMQAAAPTALTVTDQRLEALSEEERTAFQSTLDTLLTERVDAGFERLLATLGDEYEANAPDAVGLGQYPDGPEVYERRIRSNTTLALTAEEIHQRGKDAVAEISARMKAVRDELGFEGTAREFHQELKLDSRFLAANPAEVEERYMSFIAKIEPIIDDYFRVQPEAAYGVRRLPLAAEPGMTFGYYNPPTADDPVGYYNYNGSDLANRSLIGAGSLIYHELLPGHHFHIATQAENEALQALRQRYSVGAFTEGWAEYAASLGLEMGMYETPYDLYGRYIMEIFLATRLVVDTGMNAFGWSLEEARAYMREHIFHSDVEIASETLRYSTSMPAQALAYRLGYEKMWELRKRAEESLGDAFDIRDYHDVVLTDGAKPLPVLEAKVDRYIAAASR